MDAEYEDLFWLLCRHYEEHRCRGSGLLQHIYRLSQLPGPINYREVMEHLWISYNIRNVNVARGNRNILREFRNYFQAHLRIRPGHKVYVYQKIV